MSGTENRQFRLGYFRFLRRWGRMGLPIPGSGPHAIVSDEFAQKMLLSEAATLKFLKACSPVPVPEVFSFKSDA